MSSSKVAKTLQAIIGNAATYASRSSRCVSTARSALPPHLSQYEQQCLLTKAYLSEYVKAANGGKIATAMEALLKAQSAGQHLHVRIPDHIGSAPGGLAPMAIVVPTFASDSGADKTSDMVMPFWIDMPSDAAPYPDKDHAEE
jgi:hypothetical protein